MKNNEEKIKYIGEIVVILCLEIIMLLFRMVQPIAWPAQVPLVWQNFGNELIFAGIEFGLIIVIVAHFIFKKSFKELGLKDFKENMGSLIGNLCFVAICVGTSFIISQFSKLMAFNSLNIVLQIIANFVAIAFIRELVFRGFLFEAILKLLDGKGIIASIISGVLFAMTYIPNILINLNEVHTSAVLSALAIPLAVGIYLGLIYYYGGNLWLCMIIHGVYLSITTLEADIFINLLSGVYSLGLLIYLIYKILGYYKHVDKEDENMEFEEEEVAIESKCTEEVEHQANVDYTHEIERQPQVEALKEKENTDISQVEKLEDVIVTSKEVEDKAIHESKVVEVPKFKNTEPVLTEKLEQTTILPNLENEEEEDLGKIAAIPNTQEELGKVVNLQDRKQKMERSAKKIEDLDITVVMPCITEADMKENQTRFEPKDVELKIQAEPNFIAHLEKYLGDFEGIYKQIVPTEIPIDILYFSGEKYNAIVTNGMRAVTMSVPPELKGYEQVELMMFIDKSFDFSCEGMHTEESAWLIRLLTDLALYPSQINSYLGWGHIVGNGEELEAYNASAAYCGALIYPPMVQEDMTFYRYIEKDKNIFIYNVMPLFKDELRFIQEHSSDQFVNLMSEMGVSQVVKPKRLNVIKNMNR